MSRHVGFAGGLKLSGLVTLDDLPDDARAAQNDGNAGGGQRPKRVRPAIARQDHPGVLRRQQLSGLNSGAAFGLAGVFQSLERIGLGIDKKKVGTACKPRIDGCVQSWPTGGNDDFHDWLLGIE
jgi:hypothetical protein